MIGIGRDRDEPVAGKLCVPVSFPTAGRVLSGKPAVELLSSGFRHGPHAGSHWFRIRRTIRLDDFHDLAENAGLRFRERAFADRRLFMLPQVETGEQGVVMAVFIALLAPSSDRYPRQPVSLRNGMKNSRGARACPAGNRPIRSGSGCRAGTPSPPPAASPRTSGHKACCPGRIYRTVRKDAGYGWASPRRCSAPFGVFTALRTIDGAQSIRHKKRRSRRAAALCVISFVFRTCGF